MIEKAILSKLLDDYVRQSVLVERYCAYSGVRRNQGDEAMATALYEQASKLRRLATTTREAIEAYVLSWGHEEPGPTEAKPSVE